MRTAGRAAFAARDAAMEQVDRNADREWREKAYTVVCFVAANNAEFTSDDVWAAGLPKPREARALGPVMARAARQGVIIKTDRVVRGADPEHHADFAAVWASRVHRPDEVIKVASTGRTIIRRCTRKMPAPVALAPAVGDLRRHEPKPKRGSAQSKKPVERVRRDPAPKLTGDALQDYLDKKAGL